MLTERDEARRELALRRARTKDRTDLGAFIPRLSPEFDNPKHLGPLCQLFDRIEKGESVFALVEAPPRHGKSETVFHGMARAMRYSKKRVAYATYSNQFAFRKSRRIRALTSAAGGFVTKEKTKAEGEFAASASVSYWETSNGSSLISGGRGGGYKGEGFDLICLDDPYKNREEYESPVIRDSVFQLWQGTLRDRIEPGGSVIIFHQRWGEDDLIGRLKKQKGGTPWEVVTLPALNEDNEPLWPERYGVEALQTLRGDVGEYNWFSQFIQRPVPRGSRVFGEAFFYDELPPGVGFRVGYGLDLAYSKDTKSDYSVSLRGKAVGKKIYVTDMLRKQETILVMPQKLKEFGSRDKGAPWGWFVGGQETAVAATLKKETKLRIKPYPAKADKFTRAIWAAAAWKRGEILLPAGAPWVDEFLNEVQKFTGTPQDVNDDIVDALVALYEVLIRRAGMVAQLS